MMLAALILRRTGDDSSKVAATLTGGGVFCQIDKGGPDGIRCDAKGRIFSSAGDGVA